VTSNIKNVAKVDIQQNAHRYTLVTDFQTFLKCLILQSEEYKQGACPEFQDYRCCLPGRDLWTLIVINTEFQYVEIVRY